MSDSTCANALLLGCGILQREVCTLVAKNNWPVDVSFLDSSLHIDLDKLATALTKALEHHSNRELIVFYGCCHPLMENMLDGRNAVQTDGQNCVEMLLGSEVFACELQNGAFFLLEEWAASWEDKLRTVFGDNIAVMREMIHGERKYLLAIRTPCSADFTSLAERAAALVDLPLRWIDVSLEHLESVLERAVMRRLGRMPCPR